MLADLFPHSRWKQWRINFLVLRKYEVGVGCSWEKVWEWISEGKKMSEFPLPNSIRNTFCYQLSGSHFEESMVWMKLSKERSKTSFSEFVLVNLYWLLYIIYSAVDLFYSQYEFVYHVFGKENYNQITANLDLLLRRFNEVRNFSTSTCSTSWTVKMGLGKLIIV